MASIPCRCTRIIYLYIIVYASLSVLCDATYGETLISGSTVWSESMQYKSDLLHKKSQTLPRPYPATRRVPLEAQSHRPSPRPPDRLPKFAPPYTPTMSCVPAFEGERAGDNHNQRTVAATMHFILNCNCAIRPRTPKLCDH